MAIVSYPAILALLLLCQLCVGKIMVFEKSTTSSSGKESDVTSHLPLSSLFKQSSHYQCKENDASCQNIGKRTTEGNKIRYGPKYQKIHLALPRIEFLKIGHEENVIVNGRKMKLKTLSQYPHIVEISNFLSENETELIIDMAISKRLKKLNVKPSQVYLPDDIDQDTFDKWDKDFDGHLSDDEMYHILEMNPLLMNHNEIKIMMNESHVDADQNGYISFGELSKGGIQKMKRYLEMREVNRSHMKSRGIKEAWLWHDEDELLSYEDLLEDYHERIEKVSMIPKELLEQCEPLHVLKHEQGSFGFCQHDSKPLNYEKEQACCSFGGENCRICRYATLLMFLNDVEEGGKILFPLADNSTFDWANLKEDTIRKCESIPNVNNSNLVIKPKRGSALLYYNHVLFSSTGWMGHMEPQSLLGSTVIEKGERWIAKMWINIIGDGVNDLRPWRMGTNWLSPPNVNHKIIKQLRNDYFREGERYIHRYRSTYVRNSSTPFDPDNENQLPLRSNEAGQHYGDFEVRKNIETKIKLAEKDLLPDPAKTANTQGKRKLGQSSTSSKVETKSKQQAKSHTPNEQKTDNSKKRREPIQPSLANLDVPLSPINAFKSNSLLKSKKESNDEKSQSKKDAQNSIQKEEIKKSFDPKMAPPANNIVDNRLLKASLLLADELDREELEIIARNLHDKLQLACIPLIVNPI